MYIIDTLYYLYKPFKRKALVEISGKLSKGNPFKRIAIIIDMVYCSLIHGAMFTEYGDLGFFYRKNRNRKTYLTTFYNFKFYDKVNQKDKRVVFHNKLLFLKRFSAFIKREWIDLSCCSESEFETFLKGKKSIVLKSSMGDSGKEVCVIDLNTFKSIGQLSSYIHENNFNLVEECVSNCPELESLNSSSLNTLRITTFVVNNKVNILFAGLRVGAKGAKIDNISQGGYVAKIDIESGKICSDFYKKESSSKSNNVIDSAIGFQIPFWDQVLSLINKIALVEKDVRFISWDICISPSVPDVIEGNESFGSVILQVFNKFDEPGLKPEVEKFYSEA